MSLDFHLRYEHELLRIAITVIEASAGLSLGVPSWFVGVQCSRFADLHPNILDILYLVCGTSFMSDSRIIDVFGAV